MTRKPFRFLNSMMALLLCSIAATSADAGSSSQAKQIGRASVDAALDRVRKDSRAAAGIVRQRYGMTDGEWRDEGPFAVWRIAVRLPGAGSVAFHASEVRLPKSAVVLWKNGRQVRSQTAPDWEKGLLWSLPVDGDEAILEVRLPQQDKAKASLVVDRFDVTPPQTTPQKIAASAAPPQESDGSVNYECARTPERDLASRATVQLNIEKPEEGITVFCTGTLVNSSARDGTPYILTAQHCEAFSEHPSAPSERVAYFNAKVPCGGDTFVTGGSVATAASEGMSVVASYGDTLLYKLDDPVPVNSNAYWSGWDFTDTTEPVPFIESDPSNLGPGRKGEFFVINEAGNRPQLFARDSDGVIGVSGGTLTGLPQPCTGVNGSCVLWQAFAKTGRGDGITYGGASGSGLVDQLNHVIGVVSFGEQNFCYDSDPECGSLITAQQLAESWNGRGTPQSSFAPWLDQSGTGSRIMDGAEYPTTYTPTQTLTVNPTSVVVGQAVTIAWDTTGSLKTCTITVSRPSNTNPIYSEIGETGSIEVTADSAGTYSIDLFCPQPGGSGKSADVRGQFVAKSPPPLPTVTLSLTPPTISQGSEAMLAWSTTNASSCVATDAWTGDKPTSGSASTSLQSVVGTFTYGLRCTGAGGTVEQSQTLRVQATPPTDPGTGAGESSGGGSFGWLSLGLLLIASRIRRGGQSGFAREVRHGL